MAYPSIPPATPETATAAYVGIGVFLLVCVAVSVYMMRKARTFDEWLVGKRDIGPVVTGFALVAT